MGDGKVALILDVGHLARRASVVSVEPEASREKPAIPAAPGGTGRALLLFRTGRGRRMVIPLSSVARLEELSRRGVEAAGDHRVIQYRGRILTLLDVDDLLGERRAVPEKGGPEAPVADDLQVIVYTAGGRSIGLVVDRILDVVEEPLSIEPTGRREGILGTMVVGGRVTEVVDVEGLIQATETDLVTAGGAAHA
jgi:two-component system chemotaxis sensor kinase CheA